MNRVGNKNAKYFLCLSVFMNLLFRLYAFKCSNPNISLRFWWCVRVQQWLSLWFYFFSLAPEWFCPFAPIGFYLDWWWLNNMVCCENIWYFNGGNFSTVWLVTYDMRWTMMVVIMNMFFSFLFINGNNDQNIAMRERILVGFFLLFYSLFKWLSIDFSFWVQNIFCIFFIFWRH